jgi:hypothetical protein
MIKAISEKLFCKHSWTQHAKEPRSPRIITINSKGEVDTVTGEESTREILICVKCGKIKSIKY